LSCRRGSPGALEEGVSTVQKGPAIQQGVEGRGKPNRGEKKRGEGESIGEGAPNTNKSPKNPGVWGGESAVKDHHGGVGEPRKKKTPFGKRSRPKKAEQVK